MKGPATRDRATSLARYSSMIWGFWKAEGLFLLAAEQVGSRDENSAQGLQEHNALLADRGAQPSPG